MATFDTDLGRTLLAIIPYYKRADQLDRCLAALAAGTIAPEPFVHDNSLMNLGFTAACNIGLRAARKRADTYALLINQDCYVEPDTVAQLCDFMDRRPKCAVAGVKQVRVDDPDEITHGGCTTAYPEGRHIVGRVSRGDCSASTSMPWVNGACWIVRMEAVAELGLLDESYFLIGSDADYCFTARQRGWEVWYCADAVARHEIGGISSGDAMSLEQAARCQADQRRFRDKWLGTVDWELLSAPISEDAHEAAVLLREARTRYERGEVIEAEVAARRALAANPETVEAHTLLGLALLRGGWYALSVFELRQALKHRPEDGALHFTLGDALNGAGEPELAIDHYTRAMELGLTVSSLYNNRGLAFACLGRTAAAQHDWRMALDLDPRNESARSNLAGHPF